MPHRYQRQPEVVTALQWTTSNLSEFDAWLDKKVIAVQNGTSKGDNVLILQGSPFRLSVLPWSWVIMDQGGYIIELMDPEDFDLWYEELPDET